MSGIPSKSGVNPAIPRHALPPIPPAPRPSASLWAKIRAVTIDIEVSIKNLQSAPDLKSLRGRVELLLKDLATLHELTTGEFAPIIINPGLVASDVAVGADF